MKLLAYHYDPTGKTLCTHCDRPLNHIFVCQQITGAILKLGTVCVTEIGDQELVNAVKAKLREINTEATRQKRENLLRDDYEKAMHQWNDTLKGGETHE